MNNNSSRPLELFLNSILSDMAKKTKLQDHTINNKRINSSSVTKRSNLFSKKYKTIKNNNAKDNYIKLLISRYYDNDKVSKDYLETARKKIHIYPQQRRIIVIGDLHGDFEAAIKCLILSKCINDPGVMPNPRNISEVSHFFNDKLEWIGGDTYIVQLGDQIDRVRPQSWDRNNISNDSAFDDEGSTLEIFYLFYHLNKLAEQHHGKVISIIGNHEVMNVEGNFSYVSKKEFNSFNKHLSSIYYKNSKFPYDSLTLKNNMDILRSKDYSPPSGYRERLYAFAPTGLCANFIADNYYTMLQIGSWLFCHGGPTMQTLNNYSIELLNTIISMYLLGIDSKDIIKNHYYKITYPKNKKDEGILWSRLFSDCSPHNKKQQKQNLDILNSILDVYNTKNNPSVDAKYIAIGHTPQFNMNIGINSVCNNRVWRCDVGMSKAFNDVNSKFRLPQVLEIINDGSIVNILS